MGSRGSCEVPIEEAEVTPTDESVELLKTGGGDGAIKAT